MMEGRECPGMHNRTVLLVVVLVLGAVGGPAAGVVGADVTLTVSVKTAAGAPVSNADLTATWDGGSATATTASNGKAFLDVPEGANVSIEVDHPIYVRNSPYRVTDAGEGEVQITVWEKASASVSVVDADGAVEDVRVVFRKAGQVVAVRSTDARGSVESGVIEAGEYTLSFFKAGYLRKAVTLQVSGDTTEEVRIERDSVTVEFLVLDSNFDPPQPVADATIDGPDFSASTGSNGQRAVSLPVNTELTVTVSKDAYETVRRTVVIREQDRQVNVTTRKADDVTVEATNERVVVGERLQVTVTDEYGEPLPGATVYLDGEAVGQPNDEGVLQVPIDAEGEHTLFAQVDQLSSDRLTITGVQPGEEGSPAENPATDVEPRTVVERPAGFLGVPGLGQLHLRSMAIGIAGGLLLAAVLFLYVRFG